MFDAQILAEDYIAMWNETDPQRRRELVARTVSEDAEYLDPVMTGSGVDGISEMIAGAQAQFPGHTFALEGPPDSHHDRLRFSWALSADGRRVALGTDFATVGDDGRMHAVTGFLAPAA